MSWDAVDRAERRGPLSAFWVWWKIFTVMFITVMITAGTLWLVFRPASIAAGTLDRDNIKYNYEWFKSQHEAIQATDHKIVITQKAVMQFKEDCGPRKDWKREDRTEYTRLNAVLMGLQTHRADLVADYNARSEMVNRAIFKIGAPDEIPHEVQ